MFEFIPRNIKSREKDIIEQQRKRFQVEYQSFLDIFSNKEYTPSETFVQFLNKDYIVDLDNLEVINGSLFVSECEYFEGPKKLETVKGNCFFLKNPKLVSLGNLKYVEKDLRLTCNRKLSSLENLKFVGGSLFINLTSITKLPEDLEIKGRIYKYYTVFEDVDSFNNYNH